ncbi:MAG: tetratricopeptide repeat protein [Bryobacteraceae bacterium]
MIVSQHTRRLVFRAAFVLFTVLSPALSQSEQLEEQSRRGKELMSQGRFDEAADIYREMIKALPGNSGLILNLGLAEEMGGHFDKAIPHFQAVLKNQPNNVPALTSLAMSHLQLNQPAAALAPLNKLITLEPKNVDARGMLAGAEMGLGHFENAAQQYRQLTMLAPSDAKAWYGLGKAYESLAASSFERLSKLDAQSGYVALLLGEARMQQRQYRSAFFFYREAEKKLPQLPGLHSGIAQVYRSTGHADWASAEEQREPNLASAACKSPADSACHFAHGDFLTAAKAASGNPLNAPALFWATRSYNALALQSFERLGQLPESIELHALKAQILRDHGQNLEASKEWSAALAIAPDRNDPRLKTELATSLFLARDYQSAIPVIKELLSVNADAPDLNFMLGESLWRTQQADAALPYLEHALQKSPEMLPAHAALGLALASLNKNTEAIPHLEKAVSLDNDGSLHYSLARVYRASGNTTQAKANMEEYSKIQRHNAEVSNAVANESEITAPHPK